MSWEDDRPQESPNMGYPIGYLPDEEVNASRLDALLPEDPATGVVTSAAIITYLSAMLELTQRNNQPLSLICFSLDETPALAFFGTEGVSMIGRAIARCLRQETRNHDVVGRTADVDLHGMPAFLLICPLMTEEQAILLAERLVAAMMASAADPERPWMTLSVGVASMSLDTLSAESLIQRTLGAVQQARRRGGDRIWRHSETLRNLVDDDLPPPSQEPGENL